MKGSVHLIYKPDLKSVFLCVKYNNATGFAHKCVILIQCGFINQTSRRKITKKLPNNPKKADGQISAMFKKKN